MLRESQFIFRYKENCYEAKMYLYSNFNISLYPLNSGFIMTIDLFRHASFDEVALSDLTEKYSNLFVKLDMRSDTLRSVTVYNTVNREQFEDILAQLTKVFSLDQDITRIIRTYVQPQFPKAISSTRTNSEEKSITSLFFLSKLSNSMQEYLSFLKNDLSQPLSQLLEPFKDNPNFKDIIQKCRCAKSGKIADVPVKLNGQVYNLETLTSILPDRFGERLDPINGIHFELKSINPMPEIIKEIMNAIECNSKSESNDFDIFEFEL